MAIIATLLPDPLHVQRLRHAIRDRHELHECADWTTLARTCDREPVRVAIVDLYWQREPDFEGVRQIKQRLPRLTLVAYVTMAAERGHDLFDAGRAGIDGLVLAGQDDAPRPLLGLIERAEAKSLAGLIRRSLDGVDVLVADAVLLAVTRAQERLSPTGLSRLLAQPRRAVTHRLAAEGFPPPQRLLTWGRLIVAAHMLEDHHRSADRVAATLDFPSGSAFRNTSQRYLHATPERFARAEARAMSFVPSCAKCKRVSRAPASHSRALRRARPRWPCDAMTQLAAGELAEAKGDYVTAAAAYRASIDSPDDAIAAEAHFLLARVSWRQGRFDAALGGYEKARALAERLGDQSLNARVRNGVGATHYACGEYILARQAYAEAVAISPDPALRAKVTLNLGALENAEGRHAAARDYYHRAYELFVSLGDDANASLALHNRGLLDAETAQWATADASFVAALDLATDAGNRELIAKTLVNRSEVLVELGRLSEAIDHCDRALAIFGEIGDEVARGEALRWRAHALGRGGDYAAAERSVAEAMHIALRAGARLLEAQAARDLGVLRGLLGDRAGGMRELRRALALFTELGARREAVEAGQLLQRPTPNRTMARIELADRD